MPLDLDLLKLLAARRSKQIFNIDPEEKPDTYFTTLLGEECGEVCGAVKKSERPFTQRDADKLADKLNCDPHTSRVWNSQEPEDFYDLMEKHKQKYEKAIADEIADSVIALALIAGKHNINIESAIRSKFNQVSDEMDCPQFKI